MCVFLTDPFFSAGWDRQNIIGKIFVSLALFCKMQKKYIRLTFIFFPQCDLAETKFYSWDCGHL